MAMVATYGLRNHEIWHVDALPGEIDANPRMISVGSFSSTSDGSETKTGHRFALALPEAWIERYRLNDLEYAFKGRDAPAQDFMPDGLSLSDQATVFRCAKFRDRAAGMAPPRRGDGQSGPAPGTARHPFLVV